MLNFRLEVQNPVDPARPGQVGREVENMSIKEAISERILQLCKENNLNVNKLANLAGLPQSTLNDVVHGKSKNPTIKTIYYLCFGLGIELKDFFDSDLFTNLSDND